MPTTAVIEGHVFVLGGMPVGDGQVGIHQFRPLEDLWWSYR